MTIKEVKEKAHEPFGSSAIGIRDEGKIRRVESESQ